MHTIHEILPPNLAHNTHTNIRLKLQRIHTDIATLDVTIVLFAPQATVTHSHVHKWGVCAVHINKLQNAEPNNFYHVPILRSCREVRCVVHDPVRVRFAHCATHYRRPGSDHIDTHTHSLSVEYA